MIMAGVNVFCRSICRRPMHTHSKIENSLHILLFVIEHVKTMTKRLELIQVVHFKKSSGPKEKKNNKKENIQYSMDGYYNRERRSNKYNFYLYSPFFVFFALKKCNAVPCVCVCALKSQYIALQPFHLGTIGYSAFIPFSVHQFDRIINLYFFKRTSMQ